MSDEKPTQLRPAASAQAQMIERAFNTLLELLPKMERLAKANEKLAPMVYDLDAKIETNARQNDSRWERTLGVLARVEDNVGDTRQEMREQTGRIALVKPEKSGKITDPDRWANAIVKLGTRGMVFVIVLVATVAVAAVAAILLHLKGL